MNFNTFFSYLCVEITKIKPHSNHKIKYQQGKSHIVNLFHFAGKNSRPKSGNVVCSLPTVSRQITGGSAFCCLGNTGEVLVNFYHLLTFRSDTSLLATLNNIIGLLDYTLYTNFCTIHLQHIPQSSLNLSLLRLKFLRTQIHNIRLEYS